MKVFSKLFVFVFGMVLLMNSIAFGEENKYADSLYEIGIIYGTDKGFEEERTLTRAEAAAVVVRLLGEEDNIKNYNFKQKFTDVPENHWAFDYIMYCESYNITYGTGENTFSPDSEIDARQFLALILRTMGYSVAFEDTFNASVECKLLNSSVKSKLENKEFTRGDMFYIVYRALKTYRKDNVLMAYYLAEKGAISEKQAKEFDVYENFDNIDELIDGIMN